MLVFDAMEDAVVGAVKTAAGGCLLLLGGLVGCVLLDSADWLLSWSEELRRMRNALLGCAYSEVNPGRPRPRKPNSMPSAITINQKYNL